MPKDKIISVQMPIGLLDRIDRELELGEYTSRSDLIKVAVRIHIQYLEDTRVNKTNPKDILMKEESTSSGRT